MFADFVSFQMQNMDLTGGRDFECAGSLIKGKCAFQFGRSSYRRGGKIQCIAFGSQCKGFVYNMGRSLVILKSELTGKLSFSPGIAVFVKKDYLTSLDLKIKHEECAAELKRVSEYFLLIVNYMSMGYTCSTHSFIIDSTWMYEAGGPHATLK